MLVVLILIVVAVVLLLCGVPLFVAFGIAGMGMMIFLGLGTGFAVPCMFTNLDSTIFMAIPFFIFAGGLMTTGGIAERIFAFAQSIIGRIKGGLGVVTVLASAFFGAISGSSAAGVSAISMIAIPQMEKFGYKKSYATALVACSGVLGQLIPPSIPMILFGMLTGTSVAACFLAAFIPGLIIVVLYSIINLFYVRGKPEIKVSPRLSPKETVKDVGRSAWKSGFALFMPIIVLGSIYGGLATPTEAGCIAVVYAVIVGFIVYKQMTFKRFMYAASETASIEGAITIILCFIFVLGRIFNYLALPETVANAMLSISENPVIILLLINAFMLFQGMLMDDLSCMIISAPLLFPLFMELGISPLQMAAILAVNQGAGQLTPPVATNLFVAARVARIPVSDFIKEVLPFFFFGSIPVIFMVTFIPELSLWLPNLIMGS
ncbi:C4-dicarboxylate TRAP transporter large permease protein DctM [subsurface metagenome]